MHTYKAKVINVVDGDTVDCEVDLGFYMVARIRFRLARINTPEMRGEEKQAGQDAKQWLIDTLAKHGNEVIVSTKKTGKYGRWLGELFFEGEENVNVNDELVKAGHATYYG